MTKAEFKKRWESNDNGGGITFDDIAACALKAAGTNDAEEYLPNDL